MKSRLALSCLLALSGGCVASAAGPSDAEVAFGHLKSLSGNWSASSTKGWTETATFETIAGGSAVVEASVGGKRDEAMLSVFHMDGQRLLLTHYCVAKNQPRLVATAFANGGRTVTFTFLDATNLPTHDHGHMDKVVYTFVDDDHFTSRWTWFENGREQWLEEITSVRQPRAHR